MTKKYLMTLAALLLALLPTGLKAQAQTEYVTDVYVIGSDYESTIDDLYEKSFKPYGWKRINYDLNKGCGYSSHYIYLLYKTGTDVAEAITDLYLWVGDNNTSEKTFTFEGRTYTRSSYNGDEDFLRSKGDLNTKAEGAYIFVYYTKDNTNFTPARAITDITVDDNSAFAVGMNGGSTPCDLNKGAGGDFIYLHTQKTVVSGTPFDVSTEAKLREVITLSNINIRLTADLTLGSSLIIPNGVAATIDLNDHRLARSLTSSDSNGQVLQVNSGGTLTLTDGGSIGKGCVTGGWATNNGGGIWVQGNLIMEGGIISGNKAEWGGGIFIKPEGTVTMTGGTIKDNTVSKNGGGIYIQGTLNMSGSPVVERNTQDNVCLPASKVVNVTGAFREGARVGITADGNNTVITSGYGTHNSGAAANAYLYSDAGLNFSLNDKNEVKQAAPTGNWLDFRSEGYADITYHYNNDYFIEFWIKTEEQLALLAYEINNNTRFGTAWRPLVHLEADLDMSAHEWTAIGTPEHPFNGNFDGHGHTIKGIWFSPNNTGDYHGLFGVVRGKYMDVWSPKRRSGGDYIQNLVLANANVTGGKYVGGLVGSFERLMSVQNVVCQANVKGTEHVGGVFGRVAGLEDDGFDDDFYRRWWTNIHDCYHVGGSVVGTSNVGPVFGSTGGVTIIERCYYYHPFSDTGNSNVTRVYSVSLKDIPAGVTVDYTSDGVNFENLRFAPAGTVNFIVNNTDITNHVRSVKVNGTEVGTSTGSYSFTIDPATATDYVITVETEATSGMAGNGTQDSPYQIMTTEQWNYIAQEVEHGDLGTGQYFELCTDLQVATMIGSAAHRFTGHFDGKDHTLNVSYGSGASLINEDAAAPFRYVNGGTFKNLHVAGDIHTSAKYAAGIVANQSGDVTIENCRFSVAIHSHTAGDGTHGGLVGINNDGTLTIRGCLFDGRMLSEDSVLTTHCGGFIGWRAGTATIYNSVFDPAEITVGDSLSATFARNGVDTYDSYYTCQLCDGTNYTPHRPDPNWYPNKYSNGRQLYPATAIEGVTAVPYGNPTVSYNMSGLTFYNGCYIREGSAVIYAGEGNQVKLNLTGSANGYVVSDGSLTGSGNPYTLTMSPCAIRILPMSEPPTTIASADDWAKFCAVVNNGIESYSGKTVTLTANIGTDEHPIRLMAGTSDSHKFKGTFDGGGHTLTFLGSYPADYCAPFRYIEDATIKNLHTAGRIITVEARVGGIAAQVDGTCTFTNCRSNMDILGDCGHEIDYDGGLISTVYSGTTTIDGCLFYGKLRGQNGYGFGGFVGLNKSSNGASVIVKNSLFIPEETSVTYRKTAKNFATFAISGETNTKNITITNCFYSETLGTKQGNEIVAYATKPANFGAEGTFHNVSLITACENGLKFGNNEHFFYIMVPEAISLADAADNSQTISDKNGYLANVTLTDRTLYKDGKWNTLCLPFDVVLEDSPLEGAVARPLSGASITGTTLNLTFGEPVKTLVAGTPYIIKWASGDNLSNPVFNGVLIDATDRSYDNGAAGDSRVRFMGTYKSTTFDSENVSILLMGGENTLYYPNKGAGIGAQRAYFKIGDTAQLTRSLTGYSIDFGEGDETMGMISIHNSQFTIHNEAEGWYSLDGRKLNGKPTQKGVYINKGIKVVIK